jgi:hypothetical protein
MAMIRLTTHPIRKKLILKGFIIGSDENGIICLMNEIAKRGKNMN